MTTPDHVENTGDNLRHAKEVQERAQETGDNVTSGEPETLPPDFNT